jgi:transmembrane sensor
MSGADSLARMRALAQEQAAEWVVRLDEAPADATLRAELAAWLAAAPLHVDEFLRAAAVWRGAEGEALADFATAEELIAEARASTGAMIARLPASAEPRTAAAPGPTAKPSPRRRLLAAGIAAAVAVVALGLTLALRDPNTRTYATGIGEQETYALPDGSTLSLNTHSRVRLNWTPENRDLYLIDGEALFEVAHDEARPFRVWTGNSWVRAVGTKFNVRRAENEVTVTVIEGRVEIAEVTTPSSGPATARADLPPAPPPRRPEEAPVLLSAGHAAQVAAARPIQIDEVRQPERTVAWQSGRLVFDDMALRDVFAEFNRYYETPLVIDEALGQRRISGVFNTSDRASLLTFLEEFEGLKVERQAKAIRIRAR